MKRITKIVVIEQSGQFILRTSNGFPIGSRLLSVAPETGKDLPDLRSEFPTKTEAARAALDFNMYLLWAAKKKSKSRARFAD